MATRRINYTGRKRLLREDMRFTVHETGNAPLAFDADLNLSNYNLPEDGLVMVEAYRQTTWMRFRFGVVAQPAAQDSLELNEFDTSDGVLFRVRVISSDAPKGLLIAEADAISPMNPDDVANRKPLLSVKPDEDLADQVYRIDFSDRPILLINPEVNDWRNVAQDPIFTTLALPSVFREILTRILYIEGHSDTDDDEDWKSQWLKFATLLPGISDVPNEEEKYDEWIDEALASFCRKFDMLTCFKNYQAGV